MPPKEDTAGGSGGTSKKRRRDPSNRRSLCIVLQALLGKTVHLELKDGTEITGVIADAGINLSMTLMNATVASGEAGDGDGPTTREMDVCFVHGAKLLYVHIPKELNAVAEVLGHLKRTDASRRMGSKTARRSRGAASHESLGTRLRDGGAAARLDAL